MPFPGQIVVPSSPGLDSFIYLAILAYQLKSKSLPTFVIFLVGTL